MVYILDTNIISYIIKNKDFSIIDKFETISKEHKIGVSSITVAELYYGVRKRASQKLEALVNEFLLPIERYSFDENAAAKALNTARERSFATLRMTGKKCLG